MIDYLKGLSKKWRYKIQEKRYETHLQDVLNYSEKCYTYSTMVENKIEETVIALKESKRLSDHRVNQFNNDKALVKTVQKSMAMVNNDLRDLIKDYEGVKEYLKESEKYE